MLPLFLRLREGANGSIMAESANWRQTSSKINAIIGCGERQTSAVAPYAGLRVAQFEEVIKPQLPIVTAI